MTAEDSLRNLFGPGCGPLAFLGHDFALRPDGLIPLLRYARTVAEHPGDGEEARQAAYGAMHRLLEDCVVNFVELEQVALLGKAQWEDITGAVNYLISSYCARSHWAGMRLVGFLAQNFEEVDGQLLRATGRSLASLSAREACNLSLAILLDGREEEDRVIFLEDLNFEGNPEAEALAMVRQMQADKRAAQEAEAARG